MHATLLFFAVVHQQYVSESSNEYVILGNDALFKCIVPSFVSDLVELLSWVDNEDQVYIKGSTSLSTQKKEFNSCMVMKLLFRFVVV